MIYLGIDWAERHHDACVMDEAGAVLAKGRVPEGVEGLAKLHEMVADFAQEPAQVLVGIETDRGLFVGALLASGYRVYAINPMAASRYRDRHQVSGAKSDPGDAKMLADLVRTDRHNHREVAGDSVLAEAIKVLARAHQRLVWTRGRQANQLRSTLREFYPGALEVFTDLHSPDAMAVLAVAPTPEQGRQLSAAKIRKLFARAGRQRNLEQRSAEIAQGLGVPQLEAPGIVAEAFGATVVSAVAIISTLNTEITRLSEQLSGRFEAHPDAEILKSLPGLGSVLGARVLAEFGDDPARYADARGHGATTRGWLRSPEPRAPTASCSPGWRATGASRMRSICGRSVRRRPQAVHGRSTTASARPARPTTRPCGHWATAGSGSCTAAWCTARYTTRTSPGRAARRSRLDICNRGMSRRSPPSTRAGPPICGWPAMSAWPTTGWSIWPSTNRARQE